MPTKIKERNIWKKHVFMIGVMTFLLLIMLPTVSVKAETVGDPEW